MKTITVFILVTIMSSFSHANTTLLSTYEDVRDLLTMDKAYQGVVMIEANKARFMCMHILFKKDDKNQRLDYYFKAWGMSQAQNVPCDYTSTAPTFLSTNQCIEEVGTTADTPQINLENINVNETDKLFGFRILDIPNVSALSRCRADANGKPSQEADILDMTRESMIVDGKTRDVLKVQLKLFVNPPPHDVLNYIIFLD